MALSIKNLCVSYGGITALDNISFEVPDGKIVALVGANGAGKSTALRTIIGLVKPKSGEIIYSDENISGENIAGAEPSVIVKKGVTLSPEGRRVFANLTTLENLKIGAYLRKKGPEVDADLEWVFELFPILKDRSWQMAGTLSGGEQQMLAAARALMSRPKLLALDEPSLGLAPLVVNAIFDVIKEINKKGVTILLVEQNANLALKTCDYAYVLETGKIIASGTGKELLNDPHVIAAYLGAAPPNPRASE
jgi:branched-chain amino acid transport system ATP-binding protein